MTRIRPSTSLLLGRMCHTQIDPVLSQVLRAEQEHDPYVAADRFFYAGALSIDKRRGSVNTDVAETYFRRIAVVLKGEFYNPRERGFGLQGPQSGDPLYAEKTDAWRVLDGKKASIQDAFELFERVQRAK